MHFKLASAICFNLDHSKILSSVNGLNGEFALDTENITEKEGHGSTGHTRSILCNKEQFHGRELYSSPLVIALVS